MSEREPLEFLPHEYVVANPRAPRPLAIEGVLRVGDLVIITGSYDTFKSTLALELMWSLATGKPWLRHWDFRVRRRLRVGLLQTEIDPGSYDERCARFSPAADLLLCSCLDFTFDRMDELETALDDSGLDGIAIDPLGMVWPTFAASGEPFSENAKTHVSPIMRKLKQLRRTTILVHHDPKQQMGLTNRASGSSALLNDPDVRIFVDRAAGDNIRVTVRNRLQHPTPPFIAHFESGRLVRATVRATVTKPHHLRHPS